MKKILSFYLIILLTLAFWNTGFSATFSQNDLSGTWYFYGNESGGAWEGWLQGSITSDTSGNVTTGAYTTSDGNGYTITNGSLTLAADGTITGSVTSSMGATLTYSSGKMDSNKTIMNMVYSSDYGNYGTVIVVKNSSEDNGGGDDADDGGGGGGGGCLISTTAGSLGWY